MRGLVGLTVVSALASACGFGPVPATSGDDTLPDGQLGDAPAVCASWHPHDLRPCEIGSPMGDVHLVASGTPYVYDTTTEGGDLKDKDGVLVLHSPLTWQQTDASYVALLSIASLTIDANVTWQIIGTKPLLVASWSTIDISGTLDAGSHTTDTDPNGTPIPTHIQASTTVGAGADLDCGNMNGGPGLAATDDGGSGGGGGGAFEGGGGGGGSGDTGCNGMTPCPRTGGSPGVPLAAPPTVVRGGCSGGSSGTAGGGATAPATSTTLALGGAGGGAVELEARLGISIAGSVTAGGGGGAGAPMHTATGGGGGGAGGFVGFDAPMVMIGGIAATNGGGGGASSPFTGGNGYGYLGTDGRPTSTAAPGGAMAPGGGCGKPGANGSAAATLAGATLTAVDACGGSGGGGGAGFILYWSPMFIGATSPPALAGV